MDAALRALNRFGLGARPGERARLRDPRGWLKAQLEGGPPLVAPPAKGAPLAIRDAIRAYRQAGQANRIQQRSPQQTEPQQLRQERQVARRSLVEIVSAEATVSLEARVQSERPFVERLVAFWSNHLCISTAAKVLVVPLAGSYERDVIRPHVLGRFEDMVLASARHPAMLVYLDNFQSIGPNSRGAARRRGRGGRGLNENYARELLELHTLGVNGGYGQQDVEELAKILTGWTVTGLQDGAATFGFAFQNPLHEPGARSVLGARYSDGGVAQGEKVIRDLCRHPSTSRFVATKLVTHFVADDPPAPAIERVAQVFRNSEGDLRAVSTALVNLEEAWSPESKKFRTPQDWMVAALRALDVHEVGPMTVATMRQLRQPLWAPQAPKGFADSMQDWADPDALLNRAELARTLARRLRGNVDDPRTLLEAIDVPAADPLRALLADASIAATDRVALALAGPAFQWR
ncbi:MAG: DUF1800 domain-containing protein [Acidobacteria bacterium]|nr:DUF1800 domain-containing protein [Acidobacteriota bacterium]